MSDEVDVADAAARLWVGISLFLRKVRQIRADGLPSLPETAAMKRLERGGPSTVTALARLEQISVQSMGATIAALEEKGLARSEPDPDDGRRSVISLTEAGRNVLRDKRDIRTRQVADALTKGFDADELRTLMAAAPLIERLAHNL